jgi:hypothetical protein
MKGDDPSLVVRDSVVIILDAKSSELDKEKTYRSLSEQFNMLVVIVRSRFCIKSKYADSQSYYC